MFFTAVASSYRGYFQGRGNMVPTAASQIVEQVINAVFTVLFAALLIERGLEEACAGGTLGTSLAALVSAVLLISFHRRYDRYKIPRVSGVIGVKRYTYGQLVKKIINYSIPITLSVGLQYAGNLVDLWNTKGRLISIGLTDNRANELYSHLYKYTQLLNAPIAITVALATAILPAISGAMALNDRRQVQNKVNFAFKLCFLVTLPSAVGFAVLSTPVFDLLKYGEGSYLMKYGAVVLILIAVVQIQTSILQGAGKLYIVTPYLMAGIIGKIFTNYFLISIPQINISGAIIGSIVGFMIPITLNHMVMKKTLKVKLYITDLLIKPLISSVAMGIAVFIIYKVLYAVLFFVPSTYVINAVAAFASIIAGVIVYFVLMVLIKGISRTDLEVFPNRITKMIPRSMMAKIK
jgi:stage V sporulation protein B